MATPAIQPERLWRTLMELAQLGAYQDEHSGLTGVNRLALTDADAAGRRQVRRWFDEAGLQVRTDRIGNTYGRRPGQEDRLAPVLSGSHIDSVPTGGAFDGALGVVGALEVVRALNDAGVRTRRPLEIAFFTDEEGARFGTDMLGSAVACGRIALQHALSLADEQGKTVGEELVRIGFAGEVEPRITPPHAYVEVHVEQGPILAAHGRELGLVTGVQGISWQELTLTGRSAHAGTTPMELRKDPGLVAALIAARMHQMARSGAYGPEMRATMGRVDLTPNRVNIVPARAVCTVDLRNPDDSEMRRAEQDLAAYFAELEKEHGVQIRARQTAKTGRVSFSPEVQAVIRRHLERAGKSYEPILSGAGHDAQELAAICPAGMIFVRGEHEGISHNPREYSTPEACAAGVGILLETLLELTA